MKKLTTAASILQEAGIAIENGEGRNPDATDKDLELARQVHKKYTKDAPKEGDGSLAARFCAAVLDLRLELQKPYQEPDFIIKNWLPQGEVTVIAGPGGSGKTMFAAHIAASCAIGRTLIEELEPTRRRSIGLISLEENGNLIVKMYQDIVAGLNLSEDEKEDLCQNTHILDGRSLNPPMPPVINTSNMTVSVNVEVVGAIKAFILRWGIDILIIDTLSRSFGGDENNSTQAAAYISALENICKELDCAAVIIHHSGKGRKDNFDQDAVRGSSVWVDNPRAVINVRKTPEKLLKKAGVSPDEYHRYISVVLAKINHGRPGRGVQMLRRDDGCLEIVQLGGQQINNATLRLAELIRVQPVPLTERQLTQRNEGSAIRKEMKNQFGITSAGLIKVINDAVDWGLLERRQINGIERITESQLGEEILQ